MGLFNKTEEEQRAAAAARAQKQTDKQAKAFAATPAGLARAAYDRGDRYFQTALDVMHQYGMMIPMTGGISTKDEQSTTGVLNEIADEGWELVTGSFVFVMRGEESRDKFLSSGQNVAVNGSTVGYYLFRRSEENRRVPVPPG